MKPGAVNREGLLAPGSEPKRRCTERTAFFGDTARSQQDARVKSPAVHDGNAQIERGANP